MAASDRSTTADQSSQWSNLPEPTWYRNIDTNVVCVLINTGKRWTPRWRRSQATAPPVSGTRARLSQPSAATNSRMCSAGIRQHGSSIMS